MEAKELYEKHKGKKVGFANVTGIICGYNKYYDSRGSKYLIMAVNEPGLKNKYSHVWGATYEDDVIVTHKDHNNGYAYILDFELTKSLED